MKDDTLVSVIIPMHGRSMYIEDAVRSALSQTYPNIEIILVDDNGNNSIEQKKTYETIRKFLSNRVHYLKNPINSGVSQSRNNGVDIAKGKYITFLDDDDIYYPYKVATQLQYMQKNKLDISICSFDRFDNDGKSQPSSAIQPPLNNIRDFLTQKSSPHAPTLMLMTELYRSIGGFPANIAYREDSTLVMRALLKGAKLGSIQTPLFNYRVHSGFRLSKKRFPRHELDEIYQTASQVESSLLIHLPIPEQQEYRLKKDYKYLNTLYRHHYRIPFSLLMKVTKAASQSRKWKILLKSPLKYVTSFMLGRKNE